MRKSAMAARSPRSHAPSPAVRSEEPAGSEGANAGHVLVADSDADSRERRQSQLVAAGFRVSVARTAFEAIVKASCELPDLIVLDDGIGDMEAAEAGRLITTCPVTAHIPIVRLPAGRRVPPRVFAQLRRWE